MTTPLSSNPATPNSSHTMAFTALSPKTLAPQGFADLPQAARIARVLPPPSGGGAGHCAAWGPAILTYFLKRIKGLRSLAGWPAAYFLLIFMGVYTWRH